MKNTENYTTVMVPKGSDITEVLQTRNHRWSIEKPVMLRERATHTLDDNLSPAPVCAVLVSAGADVDAGIAQLDAGKV